MGWVEQEVAFQRDHRARHLQGRLACARKPTVTDLLCLLQEPRQAFVEPIQRGMGAMLDHPTRYFNRESH